MWIHPLKRRVVRSGHLWVCGLTNAENWTRAVKFEFQHLYESVMRVLWERQISMRVSATTLLWEFVWTSNFYESFRHNTFMRVCVKRQISMRVSATTLLWEFVWTSNFYESFRHNTSMRVCVERQISMRVSATTLLNPISVITEIGDIIS